MPPVRKPAAKKKPAARKPAAPAPVKKPDVTGLPLLSVGSAHPVVIECARRLEQLGHGTSPASRGEEAAGILGPEELAQFAAFRRATGIEEEATAFGLDQAAADVHVSPATIAAVLAA